MFLAQTIGGGGRKLASAFPHSGLRVTYEGDFVDGPSLLPRQRKTQHGCLTRGSELS
jgi:hypothetical protein